MQLFGFDLNLAGLHLRFSIGMDGTLARETQQGNVSRLLDDLPRFQLSRD